MVSSVSQVPDWSAPEVALEPGSVLEYRCFLCTWLLLRWETQPPSPRDPRCHQRLHTSPREGDTTPLLSILSFLIQNVCVSLVSF